MARPRQFNREESLKNAMVIFWEKGYEATSLNDLLEATGLARQSLYNTFGDKRGLFLASLRRYAEAGLNFLVGINKIRQQAKMDIGFPVGQESYLQPLKQLLNIRSAGEQGRHDNEGPVFRRDTFGEIHPGQQRRLNHDG